MTTACKHAAKMVFWQCPTKSRQRIISDAAAARLTSPPAKTYVCMNSEEEDGT
jgi:hypothetical protein